jgi:hypothetical protein
MVASNRTTPEPACAVAKVEMGHGADRLGDIEDTLLELWENAAEQIDPLRFR